MGIYDYLNQDPYAFMARPRNAAPDFVRVPMPSRPSGLLGNVGQDPRLAPNMAMPSNASPYVPVATRPNTSATVAAATAPAPAGGYTGANPFTTPMVPISTRAPNTPNVLPQPKPPKPFTPIPNAGTRMAGPTMAQMQAAEAQRQATEKPAEEGGLLGSGFDDPRSMGIMAAAQALLKAGAPVVGKPAPSLGSALGDALGAFQTGRTTGQKAIDDKAERDFNKKYKELQMTQMERSLNTPKYEDVAGGAFTRVTDPVTGERTLIQNDKVMDYLLKSKTKNVNVKLTDKQISDQVDDLDNISATNDLVQDTDGFLDMIEGGTLEFGLLDAAGDATAAINPFMSEAGMQEARNSQAFTRYIARLRNELLRMAKGVQTDGDAQRAIDEIVTAAESRDTEAVRQALQDLRKVQQRTIARYKAKVQNRRKAKGMSEYDFSGSAADGVGYSVVED